MEKGKVISDIRVYKSVLDNIDGNSMPESLGNKPLNITVGSEAAIGSVVEKVEQVLIVFFSAEKATEQMIRASIKEAVELGPDMLMKFKEKKSAKCTAILYLRQLDNVKYKPLLCVYDLEGKELLREDLPETLELNAFGEILLSSKKVTIKPRKNFFTRDMEPITFVFG